MPMTGPCRTAETGKIAEFGDGDLVIGSVRNIIFIYELEEGVNYRIGDPPKKDDIYPLFHIAMRFNRVASIQVMMDQLTRAKGYLLNQHWFEEWGEYQ